MDEHELSVWAWPSSVPRWGYDARCSCRWEASGRWVDVQIQMRQHLNDMRSELEQLEEEQAH